MGGLCISPTNLPQKSHIHGSVYTMDPSWGKDAKNPSNESRPCWCNPFVRFQQHHYVVDAVLSQPTLGLPMTRWALTENSCDFFPVRRKQQKDVRGKLCVFLPGWLLLRRRCDCCLFCSLSGEAWCGFCFSEDCGWGSFLRIFLPLMFDHFRIVMFDTLLRKNWSWQALRCFCFSVSITLPETNTSPLKIGHPKRTIHLPTIDFQRQAVSFREGMLFWRIHDLTSENLRTALVKTHPLVIYIYPRHSRCDLLFFSTWSLGDGCNYFLFWFNLYLGKISILTNIFQMGFKPPTSGKVFDGKYLAV